MTRAGETTHAAFAGQGDIVPLSGFSGALIALLRDARGRTFVRKAAARPEDGPKLKRQAERQQMLAKIVKGVADMPAIEREGEAEGCYWFDMAFVPGRDATSYLASASHEQIEGFARGLEQVIVRIADNTLDTPAFNPAERIRAKFQEIDERTSGRHSAILAPLHFACRGTLDLKPTAAHGDLTLENILIDRSQRLWLIDTIDSPFDHYWIDLSKLFQDTEGRWFLHRGRPLPLSISWELRLRLHRLASTMHPRYPTFHYLLLALTFARILPYTNNQPDLAFVEGRVRAFAQRVAIEMEKA